MSACNTPFNNAVPPGSLAGGWLGSLSSAGTSLGSLRLSLVPTSAYDAPSQGKVGGWTMGGTWAMTISSASDSGTVTGKGLDGSLSADFSLQGASGCAIDLHATQLGSSLIGQYAASSCALPDSGSFSVTKQ
ncbi:MAG: hypothetical protein ACRENQ_01090 [Gemmatimonadaceae bacterium]